MFSVKSTVSRQDRSHSEDILKLKNILSYTGDYTMPKFGISPYPDDALFEAIKKFQKRNGLRVDGVVKKKW